VDETTRQRLESFLEKKGVRRTAQRQAIIEAAFGTDQHFSAEELLNMSKQLDPTVSRATVYRTLPLLCASGLLKELDFGKGYKHYDPNYSTSPDHNHIICDDCDKIVEFTSDEMKEIEDRISHQLGFRMNSQKVQLHGTCEQLKQFGACENKPKCKPGVTSQD
jgi:Fur family transcriptional regulator, ferric uptake regulator